jgi:hypothetical protein
MSVLSHHPGRVVSLTLAAMAITALAFNGPVAAGESPDSTNEPAAVVSEAVGDVAPMVAPMEDVDESDVTGDLAPMVAPMEDVDESDATGDLAPMVAPMEDVDE